MTDRVRLDVRPGDTCWFHGERVRVRLVGYGIGVPGQAWLTDGRRVPVWSLITRSQVAAEASAVSW